MKVPRTLQSVAMDERELVMYNKIFPALQQFLGEQLYEDQEVDLPIPVIFASSFKGDGLHDFLVTENLRATNYFQVKHLMGDIYQLLGLGLTQVDNTTTKVAYMTAAMTSLANIHGITFSFMKNIGGKQRLLDTFPTIREQVNHFNMEVDISTKDPIW